MPLLDLMELHATLDLMGLVSLGVDMLFSIPTQELCTRPSLSSQCFLTL